MTRRAMYWKSEDDAPPPTDLTVIIEHPDPLRGITLAVVEGERLPLWVRGCTPYEFNSLIALIEYRKGSDL